MTRVADRSGALHPAERAFVEALRPGPPTWHAIPAFHWVSAVSGQRLRGEVDVLLLVPCVGVLAFEIKAGRHSVLPTGEWIDGRTVATRTPYEQIVVATHQLRRLLAHYGFACSVHPLVAFTGMTRDGVARLPHEDSATLCADDLHDLPRSIARHIDGLPEHPEFDRKACTQLAQVLRPGFATLLPVGAELHRSEADLARKAARIVRLTDAQAVALAELNRAVSVGVRGPAGTGKTLIAVERMAQLARSGHRVLYALGDGRLLAERIRNEMRRRGLHVDVSVGHEIYKYLPDRPGWKPDHDAVIVDEAQRFAGHDRLLNALINVPLVYFFGDPQQVDHAEDTRLLSFANTIWIDLRENCRNTSEIAGAARAFSPWIKLEADVKGPPPLVIAVGDRQRRALYAPAVVRHFNSEQVEHHDIAVLGMGRDCIVAVRKALAAAGVPHEELAACCTPTDFIGMEAKAIVLVDSSLPPARALRWVITRQKRELYLGITRARGLLAVVTAPATTRWLERANREVVVHSGEAEMWHP